MKLQFDQLDRETRDYLILVRDRQGKGVPGIFVAGSSSLPVIGFVMGFCIIGATVAITIPPTHQPHVEAMLQTAGFVLGGWMIIAALRTWSARSSGKNPGHFVYADAETLYEAKGSTVHITDLYSIREAKAIQQFSNDAYKHTDITVKLGNKERYAFQVANEEKGRRMTVFLNTLAYMRDGGEDGRDEEMKKLSPEALGSVAKEVARSGKFPRDLVATETEVTAIPRPKKEHRGSSGFLAIAATLLLGVGLYSLFTSINEPFRDRGVFNRIANLPPREQPPALRLYLAHDKFTAHRDEAQQMLDKAYDNAATVKIQGDDPRIKEAFTKVFLDLKAKPVPVISLVVAQTDIAAEDAAAASGREHTISTTLADKWGSTLGDELVVFASPEDKTLHGIIDLRFKMLDLNTVEYTLTFRHNVDDEKPFATFTDTYKKVAGAVPLVSDLLADKLLKNTVGVIGLRPVVPANLDF